MAATPGDWKEPNSPGGPRPGMGGSEGNGPVPPGQRGAQNAGGPESGGHGPVDPNSASSSWPSTTSLWRNVARRYPS